MFHLWPIRSVFLIIACLGLPAAAQFHSADTSQDYMINLSELLRVIQFYNSDGFHCDASTEDGFAPGPGDLTCEPHDIDYNAQDWHVNMSELLRVIQFFYSAGYHTHCGSEDAFAPGPGLHEPCVSDIILLPGDVPLEMVWIPAGSFMMGRYPGEQDSWSVEDPQHQVTLAQGFWMGKYELTKAQWTAVMGTTPWYGQGHVLNDPNSPAEYISWNDAQSFITALNTYTGLTFRLPSEAEWEYACRAGGTTRFYWGDDSDYTVIGDYAWYYGNRSSQMSAHVVGQKLANGFGLYDMSGNVCEWCEDDWHYNYNGAPTNGAAWVNPPRGSGRVKRGGGWFDYGGYCRSANRDYRSPSYTSYIIGFRLSR